MAIYRNPPKNKLYDVNLDTLMKLCKDSVEQDQLLNAIAGMMSQGEAMLTLDSRIRTRSYEDALKNAGLSQETIDDILNEGDMSGFLGSKESQLAEAYLRSNLPMGNYVKQDDVDKIVQQLQDDSKNGVDQKIAQSNFEASMKNLCENSQKFDSNFLANEQISLGDKGQSYDIYRMDKEGGLCVTEVPKAVISANKDQIVADLKNQLEKQVKLDQEKAKGFGNGFQEFAKGEAEDMSKGSIKMTFNAAMFIFGKVQEASKRKAIEDALKQGNVKIQTIVEGLVGLEKNKMIDSMEEDHSVDFDNSDGFGM